MHLACVFRYLRVVGELTSDWGFGKLLTFCADSHSVSVPPPVTAVARKGPRSFCPKCKWQVTPKHAHTLNPTKSEWVDYAVIQAQCGNLSGNELTRNSSGKHSAEPLWTDPGQKSEIIVRQLISTLQQQLQQNASGDRMLQSSPKILACEEKATTTTSGITRVSSATSSPCCSSDHADFLTTEPQLPSSPHV